jgi:pimeloyl-ACP methyl ester carboxylesterase
MQQGLLDSAGVKLHYVDWGGAGRPLALLAGLGDTAQIFGGLGPRLAQRFRVAGLTRRGHGRSDRPEAGYDLDILVEDIRRFLDALGFEQAILAGHSFAGLEMPRFSVRYPHRVEAIVYLDALFPRLDPEPDLSGDPTWTLLPTGPSARDLASRETYMAYYKRARPAWARIWCDAIEANLLDRISIREDGSIENHHDDALMNQIARAVWPSRDPEYGQIGAPMMALVPDGRYHQGVPLDATEELRQAADRYWQERILPWLRQRTEAFRQAAPRARVVALDSPYHHIYLAEEDEALRAILDFLAG